MENGVPHGAQVIRQMGGSGWAQQQQQGETASKCGLERKPPLRPTGPVIALWAATKLAHFSNQNGNLWSILVYMLGESLMPCRASFDISVRLRCRLLSFNAGCAEEGRTLMKGRSRARRGWVPWHGESQRKHRPCVPPVLSEWCWRAEWC
jgi:hypothetical protein